MALNRKYVAGPFMCIISGLHEVSPGMVLILLMRKLMLKEVS
jgi:hypothetical protein